MTQANENTELAALDDVDAALAAESLLNEIEQGTILEAAADDLSALDDVTEVAKDKSVDLDADLGIDRSSLYADQGDGALSVGTEEEQAAVEHDDIPTVAPKTRTARKSPATPGASADATTRSGALKKKADVTGLVSLGYNQEAVDRMMDTIDAAPKKVGEKANNLLRYALGREHVANVTKFALSKLRDKPEGFTTVELVAMLQDERGYSTGTARSQAQQMSRLFGLFDMVAKDGKTMTLDGDNPLSKAVIGRLAGDPFIASPAAEAADEEEGDGGSGCVEADANTTVVEAEAPSPAPETTKQARTRRNRNRNRQEEQKLAA